MTSHAFQQFLAYKWSAKSAHGTHSPFVYDFIENVLRNKKTVAGTGYPELKYMPVKYVKLIGSIMQHYGFHRIFSPGINHIASPVLPVDILMLTNISPEQWTGELNKYRQLLESKGIVFIAGIHATAEHSKAWADLCTHTGVRMSIDLFGAGLLLFRDEFRERQHFILKY